MYYFGDDWTTEARDNVQSRISVVTIEDLNTIIASVTQVPPILIDSGASIHVCPTSYARDYPTKRVDPQLLNVCNADGTPIPYLGYRWVLFEIVKDKYVWIRFLVCSVSGPIWSVRQLVQQGAQLRFEPDTLKINFHDEWDVSFYLPNKNYW